MVAQLLLAAGGVGGEVIEYGGIIEALPAAAPAAAAVAAPLVAAGAVIATPFIIHYADKVSDAWEQKS